MSLANNYFLLYHGLIIDKELSLSIQKNENSDFFDIASLILVPTKNRADKFLQLPSFKELCKQIANFVPTSLEELNQLQYELVETISKDTKIDDYKKINLALNYLHKEDILSKIDLEKLSSLFDEKLITKENIENTTLIEQTILQEEEQKSFKESKQELETTILNLKEIFSTQEYIQELTNVDEYLENQKFSIGITGVMNAGKSTMLNALMSEEILGSAVVPETANLTIVKKGEKSSARVFYWSAKEWEAIEKSAQDIPSIASFVKETKELFKDELNNYIQDSSKSEDVDVKDLANYTSAEKSGKKCNLVKYVELKSNLDFLNDGIEIVDTPGLDDPVIQREEITKEYLAKCDLMLHLMNVSQSATLKDIEFIIDALLYQNITKLLIVITRADTVSKKELEEVIKYTKTSIEKQLSLQNKNSKLDYILNTIKFVPISGKMALLHRTNRENEAISAGYTLEDTGILEIENYLYDSLFGANSSKSTLIVKSAKNQLEKIIEKELKALQYEIILLGKSKEELQEDLKIFNSKKQENENIFNSIKNDISNFKNDAKNYITTLKTFIQDELLELQNIIKQRVFSDVKYSFEKEKKKPQNSRIKTIAQTAIKDGIVDIVRDYRYKFIKKSQEIGEICEQKYHSLGFVLSYKNDNFDARGFLQDEFKSGFLTSSNDILLDKIIQELNSVKSSKLEEFDLNIAKHIQDEFEPISQNIQTKTNEISKTLIESFFIQIQEPLKTFEKKLQHDELALKTRIENFEQSEQNRDVKVIELNEKIKQLQSIQKRVKL